MKERRAVQISHELWKQMMTQGYTTGGLRCVKGLPEGATLIDAWIDDRRGPPDLVFVFESDNWADDVLWQAFSIKRPEGGDVYALIQIDYEPMSETE